MSQSDCSRRANYGVDAPKVVAWLFVGGIGAALISIAVFFMLGTSVPELGTSILIAGLITGISCTCTAMAMVFGSKVLKLRLRDNLLDGLALRGNETVLDVGCGRGLLLIGAARRLPTGKAVGIDLWQTEDQSGNSPQRTLANADAEDVAERVEIKTGDMRELLFPDDSFDAVVSSWAIHNIYDAEGRRKAIHEIERVLKSSGRVAVVDIRHTSEYVQTLRKSGMEDVRCSRPYFLFVTPSRVITARKS